MEYLVFFVTGSTVVVSDVERVEFDEYGVNFLDKNFNSLLFISHSQVSHFLKV